MNERIRELANEAGLLVHNPNGVPTKLEKFAELIVKECAKLVDQDWHVSGAELKEYFGVE